MQGHGVAIVSSKDCSSALNVVRQDLIYIAPPHLLRAAHVFNYRTKSSSRECYLYRSASTASVYVF